MKKGTINTIIPSRKGSNRVPMKGMRLLDGIPLIEHTLNAIKQSQYLSQNIYINSDSLLWGEFAKDKQVNFYHRPEELATSKSMIDDYLYDFMKNQNSDYLAVITPTCPFITAEELDRAWVQYANNDCDTLISAEEIQTHCFYQSKDLNFSRIGKLPRSQDLEPVIALNFTIAIYDCEKFMKNYENLEWGVFTGKLDFFILEGQSTVDIDEEKDFDLAEVIMEQNKRKKDSEPQYSDYVKHLIESNQETKN